VIFCWRFRGINSILAGIWIHELPEIYCQPNFGGESRVIRLRACSCFTAPWSRCVLVYYIAHYDFDPSRQEIRTAAVVGAAVIAVLLAVELFSKKLRKTNWSRRDTTLGNVAGQKNVSLLELAPAQDRLQRRAACRISI
jgi:hypothetical protein